MNFHNYKTAFYELFTLLQAMAPIPINLFDEIDILYSYFQGNDVDEIIFASSKKSAWNKTNFFVFNKQFYKPFNTTFEEWGVMTLDNQLDNQYSADEENTINMKYRDFVLRRSHSTKYDIIISFNAKLDQK